MKNKVLNILLDYVILTVAVAVFSLAWEAFMIPNGMSSGGVTGLCTIIQFATGGAIDVSVSYLVINVFILGIGFLVLGNAFGIRTIYCIALSSVFFKLFGSLEFLHAVGGQFLYIKETVLIPIIAGVLEGVSLGVIFRVGGSTGGTDIIALIFNKYWPISPGKVFLVLDFIVITAIVFLPGKTFSDMIYGYLMMIFSSTMLDFVLVGQKSSVQLIVFSEKYKEIADHVMMTLERGVTVLKAQGWYTKTDKDVLLILISRKELAGLTKMIKSIDPRAFLSVSQVSGVYGEGFEEIKTGISMKRQKPEDEKNADAVE